MFPCLFFHCSTTINSYAMKFCRVFQEKFAFNNIKNGDLHCTKDVLLYQELEVVHWIQSKKQKKITNIKFNLKHTTELLPFSNPVGIWILKWSLGQRQTKWNIWYIFLVNRRGCLWIHIFICFFVAILHNRTTSTMICERQKGS